jgi:hypothetical protein
MNGSQHPFLVHVLAIVVRHFHQGAGGEVAAVGFAGDALLESQRLLQPCLGQGVAVAFLRVDAGVIVDLVGSFFLHCHHEIGAGGLEVVVGVSPCGGPVFFLNSPLADQIFTAPTARSEIAAGFRLAGTGFMRGCVIGHHQRMF